MFSKIPPNGDEQSLRKLYLVRQRNAAGCFPNRENILLLSTFGREPLMYVQNRHPTGFPFKDQRDHDTEYDCEIPAAEVHLIFEP